MRDSGTSPCGERSDRSYDPVRGTLPSELTRVALTPLRKREREPIDRRCAERVLKSKQTDMAKDTTGRLHVTVKTGGKRKLSSKLWLERQLNDPYVAQAKREGFRSRAAFKLIEIDDKYHFLRPGLTVVDLGAAPGGWSQIAAKRVGTANGKGKVIAIDLLEMPEIPGVSFAQLDFLAEDAPAKLLEMIGGRADVVLSDMAPNTTGHRKTDQLRILGLVEGAAAFAAEVLNPGGTLSRRCSRAAPMRSWRPSSSATTPPSGTSSRPPAGRTLPSATCWPWDFGGSRRTGVSPRKRHHPAVNGLRRRCERQRQSLLISLWWDSASRFALGMHR